MFKMVNVGFTFCANAKLIRLMNKAAKQIDFFMAFIVLKYASKVNPLK
jgi:hypothetical protein